MSTTPPSDPNPKDTAKKELTNAVIWTVIAAAVAAFLFFQSAKVDPEKKTFYLIGGAVGAIIAVINGYSAWTTYQKTKPPAK